VSTVLAVIVVAGFVALLVLGLMGFVSDRLGGLLVFMWALTAVALAITVLA
jgi:hypothetical protein